MATVLLPWRISAPYLSTVLATVIDQDRNPTSASFAFDFQRVSNFADADGIVMLSNLIEWLRKRDVTVDYANCDITNRAVRYLDDAQFFESIWGAPLRAHANMRATTYPFHKLHCSQSHQWIDGDLFPWIADALGVDVRALDSFKTCIREIFNNIMDHSTEDVGCMHLQKYPAAERLRIAISDFGIGIPTEVKKVAADLNDVQAILKAVKQGFTSKGGKNMGEGLSYLTDIVVAGNKGILRIVSGRGQVGFVPSSAGFMAQPTFAGVYYPGTLIDITLRTDSLEVPEDDGSVLQWT